MADGIGIAGGGPQRRFRGLIRRVSPRRAEAAGDDPRIAELKAALAREERISKALREVGSALGTTLDLDDLLELILDKLTDLLDADRATLYLLDEANKELVSRIVVGSRVRSIRVKVGHGIAGSVAQTGKPLRVADAYADPRFEPEWDVLTGYRTTSILAVPLKNHLGRTIGVIQVLNKHGGLSRAQRQSKGDKQRPEFNGEDEAILSALSTQAAVAIDNSRLFLSLIQKNRQLLDAKEQLERGVRDLSLLFDLERATARAASLEDLARASLLEIARACDARGAALLVADEETGDLVEYVLDADATSEVQKLGVKSGEGFLAASMGAAQVLRINDARQHESYSERVEGAYPFEVENAVCVQLEGEGRPLGAMGLFSKQGGRDFGEEDISLLKLVSANVATAVRLFRASEARERSHRLTTIGRLLSGIIHDFKTPMTVISGYVQLMEAEDDGDRRAEYAEAVLKQFDMLTSMQREVLEFARGERRVFVRKVYLHKFFADISAQLRLEFEGRPVELVFKVDNRVVARFDEGRVARAIHNLARNAVEAMGPRGGTLTISARKEPVNGAKQGSRKKPREELVISVSDTGPGIPEEIEDSLFQSFVTAGKQGGTGLGLAIVKKIVEEHEGTIEVESSDDGASFILRFPSEGPVAETKARARAANRRPSVKTSLKST
ncbi:MAG: GAF domain-containing sensor histidine kinase [Myxococcales bacterium]|nr:GAF domain-containing sensor histidine kinase [Myxococcales bacterium]